ncbi:hypothetical protein [Arthrobacter sp. MYb227]|uniref:hypothetical protein n=1 Tax=Arthrobacter sp. MYb227 TaxID=1848601 RepID=UPI0011B03E23|nr:hypothetical protein [Arthrobacter sp. MYb227]
MAGNPREIWEAFTHPATSNLSAEHKVRWIITNHADQSILEFRGKQTGVLQRVRPTMEPADQGYRLTETISFSPASGGKIGSSRFLWLLLSTGIFSKMSDGKGQTFDLLQDYLNNGAEKTAHEGS